MAIVTDIEFNQSLLGAALTANGQKVYVLSGNSLDGFLVETNEKIESRTLAPKSLNLSLYTQSDLLGIAVTNGVQLIYQ
ncbi:MAG: hypothetical protein FD167_4426 [bacterium]|nr:MAG: hypothetical protein FD167_4426 [bacterium]